MKDWRYHLSEHKGTFLAIAVFLLMFVIYVSNHPAGFTSNVVNTSSNKGVLLALVAMAQTLVVLTAGIDLSVGMVVVLTNCLASWIVVGSPMVTAFGVGGVLATGLLCGAVNAAIVIYGRLQPIVTTIATGAIFFGIALALRPVPGGGELNGDFADMFTTKIDHLIPFSAELAVSIPFVTFFDNLVPGSLVALALIVLLVWIPFRRSATGRAVYAIGSSEQAAYMSGVPIHRAKFAAYMLSGLLGSLGGLFLTFVTYSGEASAANGGGYTLVSIAAVVLGGVSLFGGSGSAIGAIFGAFMFSTIGDLLFVFEMDPLWQPLFRGLVLLAAVSLGALRLLQIRNRLDLFG